MLVRLNITTFSMSHFSPEEAQSFRLAITMAGGMLKMLLFGKFGRIIVLD
jgi:hypothetical protein